MGTSAGRSGRSSRRCAYAPGMRPWSCLSPPAAVAGRSRGPAGCRDPSPALEAQLLGLLGDVLVVELRRLLGVDDPGAGLDAEVLQVGAFHRREEFERRGGLAAIEVGRYILGHLRHVG